MDTTVLHAGELWMLVSTDLSSRVEAVHMRWLRKVTGQLRAIAEDCCTDTDLRITFQVPSTWSLLAAQRIRYLSSFRKASPFLLALSQ